jgi:hypothetical protein
MGTTALEAKVFVTGMFWKIYGKNLMTISVLLP